MDIINDRSAEVKKEVVSKALRAMEACGLVAEGHAKAKCPVDTGNLRNSITHKVVEDGSDVICYVGTDVEYGPYVELGTGMHYGGGSGGRQSAWNFGAESGGGGTRGMMPQPLYGRPWQTMRQNIKE